MKAKQEDKFLDPRHRKMLNNLLDIKGRDQAIFTRVNNDISFDITSKFGKEASKKILSSEEFDFSLAESDLATLLSRVKKATTAEEVIKAYSANKEKMFSSTKELLRTKFKTTKAELVEVLSEKLKKSKSRWVQFIRQAIDDNIQENIWSLHVATYFISIKTEAKTIYAPLLLRWVKLSFDEKDNLIITSEGDWKLNEKVLFILHQQGFEITELLSKDDKNALEHIETIQKENAMRFTGDFTEEFSNIKPESIQEDEIKVHPGVVLGLYKPRGGLLRETMSNIIRRNELDQVIAPQKSKEDYEKFINKFIEVESNNIVRIQKSNFSQDKATISALNNDTIIWGPPGTGKSQVIANLIANILYQNKTAVVMSQKKAALDVLKKRLDKLAKFCLFNLNDNNMDKAEFYKPLAEFIKLMSSIRKAQTIVNAPFITRSEKEALQLINALKMTNQYGPYMKFMELVSTIDISTLNKLIKSLDKMKRDIVYVWPEHVDLLDLEYLAQANKIKKTGTLLKKYPDDLVNSVKVFNEEILPLEIDDIREIISMLGKIRMVVVRAIVELPNKLIKKVTKETNVDQIEIIIGNMFFNKLANLRVNDPEFNAEYDRFVAAVELGRSLPFKLINNFKYVFEKVFPVIITTPQNQFARWSKNQFDYSILDESSQLFVEVGIPVLYLGKIKVLAGDPMQMRPSRWFSVRSEDDDELEDIPEEAESLLDYGMEKGLFTVMLDKNYRSSYSSLMSFSAKEFYESRLDVADTHSLEKINPIEVLNIGGKWVDGVNKVEAQKAVELVVENIEKFESIIVLTFNLKQKMLIEDILLSKHPKMSKLLDSERIKLRNIENIQGDEADLVIASVVYDSTTNMGSTYVSRSGGKHALNVAISRAKDKMIVIKSVMAVSLKESKSEDFETFRKWLVFLDKQEEERRSYSLPKLVESVDSTDPHLMFVNETIQWINEEALFSRHVKLKTNYEIGSKRIDFAIIDEHTNEFIIGVEVDSYKYHEKDSYQKYLDNASKLDFIVDKGYGMYRIREIEWRLDKLGIIKDLNKKVNLIIQNKFFKK